jgi:HAD superfamily hydrolase (TIGR01484 family)
MISLRKRGTINKGAFPLLIDTIVSDMDDTLLNDECQLTPYTIDVLRRCTERGIRVIPASGRAMDSLRSYLKQLNTGCPAIGCNGAQIIAGDDIEQRITGCSQRQTAVVDGIGKFAFIEVICRF